MKPKFEFTANSAAPDDKSGIAVWRYTEFRRGEEIETIVRQSFDAFDAAYAMNGLIDAAWHLGEAAGYAACERKVLDSLRG